MQNNLILNLIITQFSEIRFILGFTEISLKILRTSNAHITISVPREM